MRKQTKLVAVLSAAALLAVGASMTSFAGWEKDEDGIWHYYDSDDEMVTDEWRKDGSKWFYLDEDGNMATDAWVDDEYYVGADGAMIKNDWIKTTADEDVSDPDDDDCVRVLCTGACSPVGGHNTVTVRYRLRPVGGSYSGYTALENGQEQIIEGVLKTASYELELSAVDALGSVRAVEYAIPTAAVAVHLAQGGTAVGVGKYAEHDKAVDIAPDWDVWFRGKRLLDAVWPVGSIYLSASEISPETLFGGTWEQVKDRFLLAAGDVYEPGETGGEAQHTLTKAEMPAHTHGYDFTGQSDVTGVTAIRLYDADGRRNEYQGASASAGGGAAHNNMPPYLVVYVWRRTA